MPEVVYESTRIKRELSRLPKDAQARVLLAIDQKLRQLTPATRGVRKVLSNDTYRLKVGQYRVLYLREDDKIIVKSIQSRNAK